MLNDHSQKDRKFGFQDQLLLNAGQKYCRMLQGEHSATLLTFIKLPFVIKIFVLSFFEWSFYTVITLVLLSEKTEVPLPQLLKFYIFSSALTFKLGQGHQNQIKSFSCLNVISMQFWFQIGHKFTRHLAHQKQSGRGQCRHQRDPQKNNISSPFGRGT